MSAQGERANSLRPRGNQGFWRCFADGLNQSLLSFLARIRSKTGLNRTFPSTYDFKVASLKAFFDA